MKNTIPITVQMTTLLNRFCRSVSSAQQRLVRDETMTTKKPVEKIFVVLTPAPVKTTATIRNQKAYLTYDKIHQKCTRIDSSNLQYTSASSSHSLATSSGESHRQTRRLKANIQPIIIKRKKGRKKQRNPRNLHERHRVLSVSSTVRGKENSVETK
jgi:hypothetical protein